MPPIRSDADLDFMLRDAGVPVVSPQSSTYGILRRVDTIEQTVNGMPVQKRGTTILVRTGTIADLDIDLAITVDGAPYVVRLPDAQDDGALTKILIAEVKP